MARDPWLINRDMFLSIDEVQTLLLHVRSRASGRNAAEVTPVLDRLIIECLLWTGMRSSEFCRLRVADTSFVTGEPALRVRGNRKADRLTYIPTQLVSRIDRYVRETRPACLPPDIAADDYSRPLVFHEYRRPYERTGLYRRVVRILTDAGLGDRASVQLLRHTCGYLSYLQTRGNLLFVQRQLGHSHAMVTAVYAQFVDEDYAELADRIARLGIKP